MGLLGVQKTLLRGISKDEYTALTLEVGTGFPHKAPIYTKATDGQTGIVMPDNDLKLLERKAPKIALDGGGVTGLDKRYS